MGNFRPPETPVSDKWTVLGQTVVPPQYISEILELAHALPMSGYFGVNKTQDRIL